MIQKIQKFDSIIFDCDGVLVDIRNSYDYAINKTISAIMNELFDDKISDVVNSKILYGLKASGGFNDEVAVVYAVVMTLVASKKSNLKFKKLIIDVINNANESGINSIDNYFINQNIDLKEIKLKLDYENSRKISYIHRIFNQLFYGPKLYEEIFKEKSQFSEKPLIDLDNIVLDDNLMSKLKTRFGNKISTVTGRGNFAFSYSMKNYLDNFDMKNSVFLEDRSLELAKPNPESLIESISGINSKCSLYIGDSMEDLMMVEKCKEHGYDVSFCGIYGSSDEPELKYELFQKNKASFILESIRELPKALNLV
ncbi:MAG: phosphatase [Thaumarchaeota archaeon]|nr:phosphatase [Nitrososphaerota archaeon]MBT4056720.1 phosphatase [Nitrososphaerota archaeon]MBT4175325.1 phosphatase [Nitrososphaerota archaeon]MBT4675755.1 phosphatase [Nitrososphaerota archaeon]MBT4973017.1 phosphatase [Nitrososphaerota archaeon]